MEASFRTSDAKRNVGHFLAGMKWDRSPPSKLLADHNPEACEEHDPTEQALVPHRSIGVDLGKNEDFP